tara:strand:+ start:1730 stop:3712 length:1983 start_codon:yes stop_codon:yes gene_type:complete
MAIRDRRLFANGGFAQQTAINELVRQGFSAQQIFDALGGSVSFADVERIVADAGGIVNPQFQVPKPNINVNVDPFSQPDTSTLPSLDLDTGLGSLSDAPVIPQDLPDSSTFVQPRSETTSLPLGPNEAIINGRKFTFPTNLQDLLDNNIIGGGEVYTILNAPGTRLGANVQRIFENYSKSDPLQFGGENPTAAALEVARMATNLGGDAASLFLRGIGGLIPSARDIEINNPFGEGVVNIGTTPISQSIDDLEVSRDRLAEARASNIPGVSEPSVIETTYQLKPGVTADDIREFADLNPAIKALQEEEEKREEDIKTITDLGDPEPAPIDETKVISTPEVVDPRFVIDDEAKDLEEIAKTTFQEPGTINIRRRQEETAETKVDVPREGFFTSPEFKRAIKNIGEQLVLTGQMGPGLARGIIASAQEEEEEQKLATEFLREQILETAGTDTGPSDSMKKKLVDTAVEMGDELSQIERNADTIELINQALAILEQGSVTSIPALLDRGFDVGSSLFNTKGESDPGGKRFEDLSERTQVLVLLNQIAQRNIRDILGESGKTISNVDRDLVNRLVGQITVLTTNPETIKQLNVTKEALLRGMSQRANKIRTQSSFLQDEGGIGYLRSNPALLEFLTTGDIDMGQFNRTISSRNEGSVFNLAGEKV